MFIRIRKYYTLNQVIFTVSGRHTKTTRHAKEQENTTPNEEKHQSMETDPEMTQIIELVDKDIKIVIITMLHTFKKLEKRNMSGRYKKEYMENMKKTQIELQEMTEISIIPLDDIYDRLNLQIKD